MVMVVTNSNELSKYTDKKTAVALGSFDAMHKGHLKVIGEAVSFAKKNGLYSLVQLFETVPESKGEVFEINSLSSRVEILEGLDVDIVVVEKFDERFKNTKYDEFVRLYLKDKYNASVVFAGDNYRFGHKAAGDIDKLREECSKYGIYTKIIECIKQGEVISSTRIRECIRNGDVEEALNLMTRPHILEGKVIHGRGVGHTIGFPTANIQIPQNSVVPKDGVYITNVTVDGQTYKGITNIGSKPTVDVKEKNIETHISDFNADIYGETIELEFLKFIRDIKKFNSLDELKKQLKEDKKQL